MGDLIDLAAKRAERAGATEPETLTPQGVSVDGGISPDGQGVIWLYLLAPGEPDAEGNETPPTITHRIGMVASLAYRVGQLLANSAAQIEVQADQFRRQHARRLANEQKQARKPSGLILPSYVNQGGDDEPVA
jgi:hypothetical protein